MNLRGYKSISKTGVCLIVIFSCLQIAYINNSFAVTDKNLLSAIKYQKEGKYPEAITEYYEIIEKSPKNLDAYYNLAMIIEIVLVDYESALLLYDKALSIAENKITFFMPEKDGRSKNELNNIVSKIKDRKNDLTEKIFNSIEGTVFPRYIVLKSGKTTSLKSSKENEYRFINIKNNKYYVLVSSTENAWVEGDDVRLIYQNSNERITLTAAEKADRYRWFANTFPIHKLANSARTKMNSMVSRQTFIQKPVTQKQQSTKPQVQIQQNTATNKIKEKTAQEKLNEIEKQYKEGSISDEERKKLRMDILKNL